MPTYKSAGAQRFGWYLIGWQSYTNDESGRFLGVGTRTIISRPCIGPETWIWISNFSAQEDRSQQDQDLRFQIFSGFQISTAQTRSQISDLLGHGGLIRANLAVLCLLFCVGSAANFWISDLDFRCPEGFGSSTRMQDLRCWISKRSRLKS